MPRCMKKGKRMKLRHNGLMALLVGIWSAAALAEAWRLSPDQRYTSIERFEAIQSLGSEKTRTLF